MMCVLFTMWQSASESDIHTEGTQCNQLNLFGVIYVFFSFTSIVVKSLFLSIELGAKSLTCREA